MTERYRTIFKKRQLSIQYATEGMKYAFRTQVNYRIHFICSLIALALCYVLRVSYVEFLIILLLIFIGIMVEAINTAIEQTTDAIDKSWREDIKLAKDVSAGAMLMFSLGALLIAAIIFMPKLLILIGVGL